MPAFPQSTTGRGQSSPVQGRAGRNSLSSVAIEGGDGHGKGDAAGAAADIAAAKAVKPDIAEVFARFGVR